MKDPQALLSNDALEQTRPSNLNLYPRKRELEAQISSANEDLIKSKIILLVHMVFNVSEEYYFERYFLSLNAGFIPIIYIF